MAKEKPYHVYILQSTLSGRLYIGHTKNLDRRLQEHRSGQTRSTRGRGPWELLYSRAFTSRSEATRYERWLKRQKSRSFVLEHLDEQMHR